MSATDHTLTDAERAMFERIEDTGDTQGLTWRVQELVAEARALADEEYAGKALEHHARTEAAEAALAGLVAAVEAVAEASLRDGRGGTWVHDEWFRALIDSDLRALLTADTKATS